MQLIDQSFFIGELNIPNLDKEYVRESLNIFINKYQKRFLTLLLGDDIRKAFMLGLTPVPIPGTDPVEYEPIDQKWIELRDKLIDQETKESPLVNYVYYFFRRDGVSITADVGETISNTENSTVISPATKMVRAWNEMSDWVHGTKEWFHDYYATYNLDHDWYFFNLYCYESYKDEFARQNVLNI